MKPKTSFTIPLITLTSLFFMWGFITCMNDILIPYLKKVFELNYFQSMLVQFSFFGAYFIGSLIYYVFSIKTGDPVMKIGYKNGILYGLMIAALGCLLFYPAAAFKVYGLFLTALFVLALGFTLLQITANPYVAILGKPETAAGRLNLSQAFNSLGTTLAPLVGGFLVFTFFAGKGEPLLNSAGIPISFEDGHYVSAASIQLPYLFFAGLFFLLTLIVYFTPLPDVRGDDIRVEGAGALKFRQLRNGIAAIFLYVGAEVAIGSILISYFKEIYHYSEPQAKTYLAFYWGGAMIGRFLGAVSTAKSKPALRYILMLLTSLAVFGVIFFSINVEKNIPLSHVLPFLIFIAINLAGFIAGNSLPHRTLMLFAMINVVLLATAMLVQSSHTYWLIVGIGLFNSIMWSNIFTLSIDGLGKYTSQGSSLLVMAILGGALLPLLQGFLADTIGINASFIVPSLAYLYLIWYGWNGYKPYRN